MLARSKKKMPETNTKVILQRRLYSFFYVLQNEISMCFVHTGHAERHTTAAFPHDSNSRLRNFAHVHRTEVVQTRMNGVLEFVGMASVLSSYSLDISENLWLCQNSTRASSESL